MAVLQIYRGSSPTVVIGSLLMTEVPIYEQSLSRSSAVPAEADVGKYGSLIVWFF